MNHSQKEIVESLIKRGNELLKQPYKKIEFSKDPKADELLNNIREFPHAFVLACIMDRQIKAERAWLIPYEIYKEINSFEFSKLLLLDLNKTKEIFVRKSLHRFNDMMAENFFFAIRKIHSDYNDDASNIWENHPKSATIVRRFLQFNGVGIKIATMAANILAREFKIPMGDYICIDISPDIHVKRVFRRLEFISADASNDELIYCARELNPEYPGIFDPSCWQIGRNWCKPRNPNCYACYLNEYCPKKL
ncbi:MAG: iron-sulfur cluster loop [Planctomycetes bacterium RIFCSPHIGHO2_02_FULL_50_42]|nr:MAG: iron-sulfur cluster loop [Planctomycetes bacterium RIFCSPHIGHO2_02_FULL_50_42]OHB92830.1 MAG: iron-sulfur cluster loop [Planctomycetes bacterium RIFCSPHIGHO2_12_FULL_51_37]OHB95287.1 MAG: iron-sulfur cluster loop [Planctomycetes bacterium RIFCSPLOWO2_02_FULL_50_16]